MLIVMKRNALLFVVMTLVATACGGGDDGTTGTTGTTSGSGGAGGTGGSGGAGGGTGGSGGSGGGDDFCTPPELGLTSVTAKDVGGDYPMAQGGTIVDGTYHLVRVEIYAPAMADTSKRRSLLEIEAGTVRSVEQYDEDPIDFIAGTYSTMGTDLALSITCPEVFSGAVPYTASGKELWIFAPASSSISVYERQ